MELSADNLILLPESLRAGLRDAAKVEQRSVDEVVVDAVERYLEDRSWTTLLHYGAERAGTLNIQESDVDRLISDSRAEQLRR